MFECSITNLEIHFAYVFCVMMNYCLCSLIHVYITVTPFKFAAIKVRGFENMTYSRPFNFAFSYQNYFTVSYTNVFVFLHKLK